MITEFDQSQDFDVGFEEPSETEVAVEQDSEVDVSFENETIIPVELSQGEEFICEFDVGASQAGDYDGPYEVTPSSQGQTLATANKSLSKNVIVGPIPSNYGLITWNGSTLTVS